MDDNISSFTRISVEGKNNNNIISEQLYLFDDIYGIEEDGATTHFYFKGVASKSAENFKRFLKKEKIHFKSNIIEPTNWNKIWEDSFSPVRIGNSWYIRAEFHPAKPDFDHEIIISPKMAFGTGHHATTYMVLEQMEKLNLQNKKVLDLGCGSGILAIAAEKLGAASVLAIDYDPLSVENTIENSQLNNCSKITGKHANVYSFNESKFDIILANINKKVLIDNLLKVIVLLEIGGTLIISGILNSDEKDITSIISKNIDIDIQRKDNWSCIVLKDTGADI